MIFNKTMLILALSCCYINSNSQALKFDGKIEYNIESMLASGTYKEYNKTITFFNTYSYCIVMKIKPMDLDAMVERQMKTINKYNKTHNIELLDSFEIKKQKAILKAQLVNLNKNKDSTQKTFIDYTKNISLKPIKIGEDNYCETDTLKKTDWTLLEDTMTIEGLFCQKAKGYVFNKMYEAWFAPSIPFAAGPAGISGLPGVIVLAISENKKLRFQLTKLEYPLSIPVEFNKCSNEKIISKSEAAQLREKYKKEIEQKKENLKNSF
jgi:GLPGLI family protein